MTDKTPANILFITIDQWRAECLSMLGHPCLKTPHLDALAGDGVVFRSHFVQCSPCGPSRASLYTGLYMQNHRSVINGTPLDARHTNVALEARKAGYAPTLFGYTDTSPDPRDLPQDDPRLCTFEGVLPGFDGRLKLGYFDHSTWLNHLRGKGYTVPDGPWGIYDPVSDYPGAADRGPTFSPPIYGAEDSQTAFLTDAVLDDVSAAAEEPWFTHVSYLRPPPADDRARTLQLPLRSGRHAAAGTRRQRRRRSPATSVAGPRARPAAPPRRLDRAAIARCRL